jgi:hypothetical protein
VIYIGIDPGPEDHGVVWYDSSEKRVIRSDNIITSNLIPMIYGCENVCCEWIESYGLKVGRSVFETCLEVGRLVDSANEIRLIPRRLIKLHLCGTMRAKDPNVRQALLDKIGPAGTKKNPGPLYGVSGHGWSALAVAVYAAECAESDQEHKPRKITITEVNDAGISAQKHI